ncbi:MAG: uncharacterized protein A8A55_2730 [Amphiamblys sp. WSBS2006]|nr:MAG: uncharacterized protein A8A55_2730 [Amphiamblys sp. WSBS2006]
MLSFAEAPAKKAPVQKTPAQEIKKVAAPVQNFAKKRALAPTEEQALVSRKQQENETAIVGLQTRNGPVGKIKEMVNALSGGKGKGKVRPAEQDPQKGTVWAVGDREAVASIAEKSAQKGGAVAGEDELESFRKLFERLAKNENCPAWKREKLPGDLRDDGAQESFAPSEPGKDP